MSAPPRDQQPTGLFTLDQPAEAFAWFVEHGYVAITGILSEEECLATVEDLNALMRAQSPGFDVYSPDTYHLAPVSANYAMFSRLPIFSRCFLHNRQNARVHQAFALLYEEDDLLVSHDRCAFYRPTRRVRFSTAGAVEDRPEWRTEYAYSGVHLDMNPAMYHRGPVVRQAREELDYVDPQNWITENNLYCAEDGLQIQGVLNLEDNRDEDGGYQAVPGFHRRFEAWLAGFQSDDESPSGGYRFSLACENDARFLSPPVRVPVPAGSLILWDQRLAHGTRPNESDRPRCIQFLRMFPRRIVSAERYRARQEAMERVIEEAGFAGEVSAVGRVVFGLVS